jgi:hypothetical protein
MSGKAQLENREATHHPSFPDWVPVARASLPTLFPSSVFDTLLLYPWELPPFYINLIPFILSRAKSTGQFLSTIIP